MQAQCSNTATHEMLNKPQLPNTENMQPMKSLPNCSEMNTPYVRKSVRL